MTDVTDIQGFDLNDDEDEIELLDEEIKEVISDENFNL